MQYIADTSAGSKKRALGVVLSVLIIADDPHNCVGFSQDNIFIILLRCSKAHFKYTHIFVGVLVYYNLHAKG